MTFALVGRMDSENVAEMKRLFASEKVARFNYRARLLQLN
jgi:hypothetical protein